VDGLTTRLGFVELLLLFFFFYFFFSLERILFLSVISRTSWLLFPGSSGGLESETASFACPHGLSELSDAPWARILAAPCPASHSILSS